MRSPWVGSLALLVPTHGFAVQSMSSRSGNLMLQSFARLALTSAFRTATSRGLRQPGLRLGRIAPYVGGIRTASSSSGVRMASSPGGGGGGGIEKSKKNKPNKPESYYKNTVILPQTDFQQVRVGPLLLRPSGEVLNNGLPPSLTSTLRGKQGYLVARRPPCIAFWPSWVD